jgi:hypothetical protein
LKDRFRTCCPEELRQDTTAEEERANADPAAVSTSEGTSRPKPGFHLEDILLPTNEDEPAGDNNDSTSPAAGPDSDAAPKSDAGQQPKKRKPRAHRKKLEDLAELGIHGPFEKSHRRKRRPFTKQDDEEILDGLNQYGPSWTRIQRDPKYHLSSRQPTDLRDRVRNKYPEIYANIEKATQLLREREREAVARMNPTTTTTATTTAVKAVPVLEPSVNLGSDPGRGVSVLGPGAGSSMDHHQQLNRSGSREDMLRRLGTTPAGYESVESLPGSLPGLADLFDMGTDGGHGHASSSFLGAGPSETELHLNHLLLDEPQQGVERRVGQGR